jgi:hypothetical protein
MTIPNNVGSILQPAESGAVLRDHPSPTDPPQRSSRNVDTASRIREAPVTRGHVPYTFDTIFGLSSACLDRSAVASGRTKANVRHERDVAPPTRKVARNSFNGGVTYSATLDVRSGTAVRHSVPQRVEAATAAYRADMDPLRDFIAGCCITALHVWALIDALWKAYECWRQENGEKLPLTYRQFGDRPARRGYTPEKGTGGTRGRIPPTSVHRRRKTSRASRRD